MSVSKYLVLPDKKVAFRISRYVDLEKGDRLKEMLYHLYIKISDLDMPTEVAKVTLTQIALIGSILNDLENNIDDDMYPNIGVHYLSKYDPDSYIVTEPQSLEGLTVLDPY